jgi:hypothetical protein
MQLLGTIKKPAGEAGLKAVLNELNQFKAKPERVVGVGVIVYLTV